MKVRTLCDMRIDRRHIDKGTTLEIDEALGKRLIGVRRAERVGDEKASRGPRRETTQKPPPETTAEE